MSLPAPTFCKCFRSRFEASAAHSKKAILAADPEIRAKLLKDTHQISLGGDYRGEALIPLP